MVFVVGTFPIWIRLQVRKRVAIVRPKCFALFLAKIQRSCMFLLWSSSCPAARAAGLGLVWMQKSASMQKRTSPLKFGHLAEKSGLNWIPNLSTKVPTAGRGGGERPGAAVAVEDGADDVRASRGR